MSEKSTGDVMVLPILPLRNNVLYPGVVMPLVIGRPKSLELFRSLEGKDEYLGILTQREADIDEPDPSDMYTRGTTARVLNRVNQPDGSIHVAVQGVSRFELSRFTSSAPFYEAEVELVAESEQAGMELEALAHSLKDLARELISYIPELPLGTAEVLDQIDSPQRLVYLILANLSVPVEDKMRVLQSGSTQDSLHEAARIVGHQIEVLKMTRKIQSQIKGEMTRDQREYLLRQQLKAIEKELGEVSEDKDELDELQERLQRCRLPDYAQKVADKEIRRLRNIQPSSPEHTVIRTYLDWLAELPWQKETIDNLDIDHAREVLNEDHYALDKIKKRILEYLAVSKLRNQMKGPILCFVGPPGVGKTSLALSIGKALGREDHRIALGGVHDEAEIRGHRRTYIGSMPGKIIQAMKAVGTRNPIIILDEIDKLGRDWRGDPTSAMLEVLDPAQNNSFQDHYLNLKFDLSKVLFVTTANSMDTIPAPLLDRMEVIELSGYTLEEKQQIAKRHLLPKQITEHGLQPGAFAISDAVLTSVVQDYTREAGVRNLDRALASVCRAVAVRTVEDKWKFGARVTRKTLSDFLGPTRFERDSAERTETPGVATGLAWTSTGGDILFIEASQMPGEGKLKLTGQLGDVMKESASIAISYIRSRAVELEIDPNFRKDSDIHIHLPAGGIPKDGPSAGITLFTAVLSLLTGRRIRGDIAMTGEITLRGLVLPVGGIKDKVLAAQRAGIKTVIMPERNRKDMVDVPESAKKDLKFKFIKRVEEVIPLAFEKSRRTSTGSKTPPSVVN
ncbi:MAG: ATP-dependent Lon protease [Myxococcota bacterium]|jgi:ATP-dependent Lon protease